jgi:hypothetical protein
MSLRLIQAVEIFVSVAQSICFSSKLTTHITEYRQLAAVLQTRVHMNVFRSANSIFDILGTFKAVISLTFW